MEQDTYKVARFDYGGLVLQEQHTKAQIDILLNRILHLAAPFHGCYVQGFLVKKKVSSYKTLDIKAIGMSQCTKSQDSILEVWSFRNNILKFQSQIPFFMNLTAQ